MKTYLKSLPELNNEIVNIEISFPNLHIQVLNPEANYNLCSIEIEVAELEMTVIYDEVTTYTFPLTSKEIYKIVDFEDSDKMLDYIQDLVRAN